MRGSRMTARAMAVRCFWPPERVMPRSPTRVWKPRGNSRISVAMWAMRAASSISAWVASGAPKAMLWAMVSEKRKVSCGTKPMSARRSDEGIVADGEVVDEEGVGWGVVEAGDEGDEGGFAGAGGADDGEGGAGGDIEGDVVEDFGAAGGVGEREVAEVDVAVDLGWWR